MRIIIVLGLTALLAACTKEVPVKEAPKDEQLTSKGLVNTSEEFVYVVSNGESSRTSEASRPYWMGDAKLVKFQFTENSLQVVELERNNLFRLNPTNNKVVLEIPVTHVAFDCAKDQFGECTNQEEENKSLPWKDRGNFQPKFADMKVSEVSLLPVELQNFFEDNCYQEMGSRLIGYEFSPDAVNIRLEKTFRAGPNCIADGLEKLSDLNFSSVYQYSIVRLAKVASPDYKPIEYPEYDENRIGYFTSVLNELDPDNRDVILSQKTFLNRWNPERTNIVYNLSSSFYRPHNRAILEATEKGIERVNLALAQAHGKMRITLQNGSDLNEGDIRNNFIILVDDPLAQGVIGYGPSVANPLTGEIFNGRLVMYSGTMKKYIRSTYQEFVDREKESANASRVPELIRAAAKFDPGTKKQSVMESLLTGVGELGAVNLKDIAKKGISGKSPLAVPINLEKLKTETRNYTKNVADKSRLLKDRIEAMSQHCAYPADMVDFEGSLAEALKDITKGELKPWDDLSESEKAQIVDAVMPFVWIPTLVHEVGHNLGLRHNFAGSEDKDNYLSKEELAEYGVLHDITYSSVMDYPHRTLNELPAMGKYDIAALRFAYAREVEVSGKGFVPVTTTLKALDASLAKDGQARKPYSFCTDEHVGANAGCKRFDEGSSFTEIAQNFVNFYEKEFTYRHSRNGLRNYSLFGELNHTGRLDYTFNSLRIMFEIYERISTEYDIPEEEWDKNAFLKDLRGAADTAAMFFVDTLQTPDLTCAFTELADPSTIVGILPLEFLERIAGEEAMSCQDGPIQNLLIANGLLAVGQGGKAFKNKKDPENQNPYVDQIDRRGVWIEKSMAIQYLLTRNMGTSIFDKHRKNFTHFARYAPLVLQATVDMLLNDVVTATEFDLINGQKLTLQVGHAPMETHKIVEVMDPRVRSVFGLPQADILFDEMILKTIKQEVPSTVESQNGQAVSELFEVYGSITNSGHNANEFEKTTIGSRVYFALSENLVALASIRSVNGQRDLATLPEEQIVKILADLEAEKPAPANASAVVKRIYKLDPAFIQAFLAQSLRGEDEIGRLLSLLPKAI